jgi:isoleucyl-tRNA synthetase
MWKCSVLYTEILNCTLFFILSPSFFPHATTNIFTKKFTFYDGPPFATGLPHYGHILAGTIKDIVTRYAVMNGYYVERRAGWDCHGLPVEYEIDQTLNITHRNQVLEMGIDKYNATCRSIVTRYTGEWETTIQRLGRWIDFNNDYKTMDPSFMESVWWVFAQLYEKNLVYQGYKVMPYSTACTTPLSNFEAGLNYKEVKDPAVVVSFPIVPTSLPPSEDHSNDTTEDATIVNLVAWTTTPWTLPSNIALCVHPELLYVQIRDVASSKRYILAKTRLVQLYPIMNNKKKFKPEMIPTLYEIEREMIGKDLVGLKYQPIFPYFTNTPSSTNYFQVLSDTYVTDDAGTGIVHQAPAVCMNHNVIQKGSSDIPCPVDADGNFTATVPDVVGVHVKAADDTLIALIKDMGRLVQKDVLLHTYPFCWRSDTPLIYKAVPSWFVKVEEIRDKIVENNKQTYWVPNEVKEGRFHNWLKDARDWAVSRNRFWGTPIPIWANSDLSEVICIGSIAQLEQETGMKITDLHRESIDQLEIPSRQNPGTMLRRIEEVFDCWFESGSMPYAQSHYPFENKEEWEKGFPADFIAEGLDQTRGWFYTLMVLSTALFDTPAFKNNIVNGMVLAADGQKMSKRKKNYPDPMIVIQKYGADALRMYLVNSPVVRGESLKFREDGVLSVVKEVFLPLYNAFRFFLQNIERWEESGSSSSNGQQQQRKFIPDITKVRSTQNPTDIWIQAETQGLIQFVHVEMSAYRLYTVMPALVSFGTQLTNWYVRLNRDRLKGNEAVGNADHEAEIGLQVLYDVLLNVTIIMAPFTPFITEFFYQHLRKFQPSYVDAVNGGGTSNPVLAGKSDSVHFLRLPQYDESRLNPNAVKAMVALQSIVEQGRNAREKRNISLKFPVKNVTVILRDADEQIVAGITGPLKTYILSELNTWDFQVVPKENEHEWVTLSLTPNFKEVGKKLGKKMKDVQTAVVAMTHDQAVECMKVGTLEVEGFTLDANTELESKFQFSKVGDHWESSSKADGSLVIAMDCTQDESTMSSGMSRELINGIQQLRKNAGLELKDAVEVFFQEAEGITTVEDAVGLNIGLFEAKFKGAVPMPSRFTPQWSVLLKSDMVDVGGTQVKVSICRPVVAVRDGLETSVVNALVTLDLDSLTAQQSLHCVVDGKPFDLMEGVDFWLSTSGKVRATKCVSWV